MADLRWMTSTDPEELLYLLADSISLQNGAQLDKRKLRLFSSACCQRISSYVDERCRAAIDIADRYADGEVSGEDVLAAWENVDLAFQAIQAAYTNREATGLTVNATTAVRRGIATADLLDRWWAEGETVSSAASAAARFSAFAIADLDQPHWDDAHQAERLIQCQLIRCIFRFPPALRGDQTGLAWNQGVVARLAQSIYLDRAFDGCPVLADALEEAGCSDPDILDHLRGPGPHTRGCWVVDAILGKECHNPEKGATAKRGRRRRRG
jgi:hypothetical protein